MPDSTGLQSFLGALYEHALVSVADREGRIVYVSEPLLRLSGYALSDLIGTDHCILGAGAQSADRMSEMYATLRAGHAWQGVFPSHRQNGQPFWLQATLLPLTNEAGQHDRSVMIATDVTARERQRLALEALVNPAADIGLFPGLARIVAEGLGCRGAGIGRLVNGGRQVEMLGFWLDGAVRGDFSYDVSGTPCERCLCDHVPVTVITDMVATRFPHDTMLADLGIESYRGAALRAPDGREIGVLFALDHLPCNDDPNDRAFLQIAAQRAADEVLRASAEERLRLGEARMRFALEAAELGLQEWDFDTGEVSCNDRWAELRGYQPGELLPTIDNWSSRVHPDDVPRNTQLIADMLDGRIHGFQVELRTATKDGGWRWIDTRVRVIERRPDGRARRAIGIHRDIHERVLAERHLRENQQWLQLVIDATDLGIWDWNPSTDVITYNERCASMLGYTLDELPPTCRGWTALNHPDDQPEALRQFRLHVIRNEIPRLHVELRCRAKSGEWVWVLSDGRVIERDGEGRAVRAVGIHQDISQLKKAEAALRESEARLRTIVENSPIGIFLCDADGGVIFRNQTFAAVHATDCVDDYGHGWQRYVHPDDLPHVQTAWREFQQQPTGLYDVVWRAITPVRGIRTVRVRAAAVRENGVVLGFAGTVEDITEQREAELREQQLQQQLQQAQKMEAIGQLTGGIAHDFNNSLATILGFAALAQARCAPAEVKLRQYLAAIVQAGDHARDLVEKMLAFSRSAPDNEVRTINAQPLLAEAKRMLQAVIPTTIQIDTVIDGDVPAVQIDGTALHQLVFNLVLNARDAISGHGHIRVSLTGPHAVSALCTACRSSFAGQYVELIVADDGCGIPAAHLHRVFDPFFSTKEVGKGTGMGLSVLHGIVHRVGGHVVIASDPESGTAVRVLLLPGADPAAAPNAGGAADASTTAPRDATILVVDDNPSVANFMRELLDGAGYRTVVFNDAAEALSWLESGTAMPDAIVSDQTMPGLTGLELVSALRVRFPALPAILCTGLSDRIDPALAREAGVRRIFLKPVPTAELLAELASCVATAAK